MCFTPAIPAALPCRNLSAGHDPAAGLARHESVGKLLILYWERYGARYRRRGWDRVGQWLCSGWPRPVLGGRA